VLDSSETVTDPYALPFTLRLCEAIERFTAATVIVDPGALRIGQASVRYVVERQLYFLLVGDRALYQYFISMKSGKRALDLGTLSDWARLIAPYLSTEQKNPDGVRVPLRTRVMRRLYRHSGRAVIHGGTEVSPRVLFLVIHPKFVRYLRPIYAAMSVTSAFLTIDDPRMFDWLGGEGLPRFGIESRVDKYRVGLLHKTGFREGPFDGAGLTFSVVQQALTAARPECIVIPEGNAPVYELVNQVARSLGIPTLGIQQGWAPFVHSGFRNMSYSKMCVWGQGFAHLLAAYNPDQQFVVTGNHIISCSRMANVSERRSMAFFVQKGSHLITETAWSGMLALIAWAAHTFPDAEVRVREHPSAPLSEADLTVLRGIANIRLMPPEEASLDQALLDCRVAVAMYSTTILEAAASGVVSLILNVNGFDHYHPNIAADGGAVEVNSFEDARIALGRLMEDDNYCSTFGDGLDRVRSQYFANNKDQALTAIVDQIEMLRRRPLE
jgi:hypothetical protein